MVYLRLRCPKCHTKLELYPEPKTVLKGFFCPAERCGHPNMIIEVYQPMREDALLQAIEDLNARVRLLEKIECGRSRHDG